MKIDIVTDTFSPDVNGVAMTMGRLSEGLRQRGHWVNVIHTGSSAKTLEPDPHAVPQLADPAGRIGLTKSFEIKQRWRHKRPDVIYVATESPLGRAALKAAHALGIPVASGFHTNFRQRADCTLTPSRGIVDRLAAEGAGNVYLLGSGVDTELFAPGKRCQNLRTQWGAAAGTPVAVMVGRVAEEKNFELAMTTFGHMRQFVADMQCVVVGDGPLRGKLAEKFPWVRFVGMQTGEDLARHYASADILIFSSETDTFGNVLLEGMASGLITVSFDYSAAAMHVRSGENGLKATKGDAAGFIRHALDALRAHRSHADHALRLQARETTAALGWDKVVGEFERRLEGIADSSRPQPKVPQAVGKRPKFACQTVFLSDIHLGTRDSKADEVVEFLKHIRCRKLVLNGDIIDGWALRRGGRWSASHSHVIRKVLKMTEHDGTEVVYLRGNHDDILERLLPLAFGKIRFLKEHIHIGLNGKRYLVVHGDGFDSISTHHRWLAALGSVGYDFLLGVNRLYNFYRAWRGKEYFSLSKRVKAKVKSAVCFVDRYEELLQDLARHKKCDGIICGHIHTPEDRQVGAIHYLNSGDWVESLTAIIEHHDGRMELVRYAEFLAELRRADSTQSAAFPSPSAAPACQPRDHAA
jgi:UDP-2,3-diacylglucosamine pyrophosphatase LpxH/glycosyltransferase involved in cell wall biosynthesis